MKCLCIRPKSQWFQFVVALLGVCLAAGAHAQIAGNAHPDEEMVSGDADLPAVVHESASAMTPAEKQQFSREVDLSSLAGLGVFHNGRVKTLDTLARETVVRITGSRHYIERDASAGDEGGKFKYNPLFTLWDMVLDQSYYFDKPLIHIEYLPVRRSFVRAAFPDDTQKQELELKRGRVSPHVLARFYQQLESENQFNLEARRSFNAIFNAAQLFEQSSSNLLIVAPEERDAKWKGLNSLDPEDPALKAAVDFAQAWQSGDAAATTSAAETLAATLQAIHPEIHPTTRLNLELTYSKLRPFEWGFWLYGLALISLILAFGTGRKWLVWFGVGTLVAAVAIHFTGFSLRCIIAERYAIQNQYESMTGLSLFAVLAGTVIMLWKRQWLFGAAAAGVGFMILILATQTPIPGESVEKEAAILNTSVLLKYHVTTVLLSYGLISLGFIVSLFYVGVHYATKRSRASEAPEIAQTALGVEKAGPQRTLRDLDTAQMTILQLAFWTLGVGTLLGAWWADHSWGRWWAFDPKETWALMTWVIYLIVIHLRFTLTGEKRGLVTAWLSIVGFFMMLWTYFGVNLLLPGLHAYA